MVATATGTWLLTRSQIEASTVAFARLVVLLTPSTRGTTTQMIVAVRSRQKEFSCGSQ